MVYSAVLANSKLTGGDRYQDASSGVATQIQTTAFNMVKARIKKAGLTPPVTDDVLGVAEDFYATALKYQKGRLMGDIPVGAGAGIASNDNVNNAVKINMALGDQKVDEYIQYTISAALPYDTDGTERDDLVGTQFKLDQNDVGGFT